MNLTPEEERELFGGFRPSDHAQEAEERWGGTEAYEQSRRRVADYTKKDWLQLQREGDAINHELLQLMAQGVPAADAAAMDAAERHRAHITKWFYECSPQMHAGLGQMYVADRRFTESIDQAGEGLAQYLSEAIAATTERRWDGHSPPN
jgi:hypothetical protein